MCIANLPGSSFKKLYTMDMLYWFLVEVLLGGVKVDIRVVCSLATLSCKYLKLVLLSSYSSWNDVSCKASISEQNNFTFAKVQVKIYTTTAPVVSIHWTGPLDWTTGLTFDLTCMCIKGFLHTVLPIMSKGEIPLSFWLCC